MRRRTQNSSYHLYETSTASEMATRHPVKIAFVHQKCLTSCDGYNYDSIIRFRFNGRIVFLQGARKKSG